MRLRTSLPLASQSVVLDTRVVEDTASVGSLPWVSCGTAAMVLGAVGEGQVQAVSGPCLAAPSLPFLQANLFPAALVHFGAEEPTGEWVPEQGMLLGLGDLWPDPPPTPGATGQPPPRPWP